MANGRRIYSDDEKQAAAALARQIGVRPAARKLGIPPGSVSNWKAQSCSGDAEGGSANTVEEAPQRRVAKSYTPSQRAEILEYAAAHGVTEASEEARCEPILNLRLAAEGRACRGWSWRCAHQRPGSARCHRAARPRDPRVVGASSWARSEPD